MTYYFVLVVVLSAYGSDGGNSIAMSHFRTQELCEAAAKEIQDIRRYSSRGQIETRCLRAY